MTMAKLNATVDTEKCQAYGACMKSAPDVFKPDAEGKAQVIDPQAASDEALLKAARSCPYKAITVVDEATGEQLHPRVRK
jgi:ferredoxin